MVVAWLVEIEELHPLFHQFAVAVAEGHLYSVPHLVVLLPVGGSQGLRSHGGGDLAHGIVVSGIGQAGVQLSQLLAQDSGQHYLPIGSPAQKAVWPEVLAVISIDRIPAELLLQVIGGGLLDEGVFGVGAHTLFPDPRFAKFGDNAPLFTALVK